MADDVPPIIYGRPPKKISEMTREELQAWVEQMIAKVAEQREDRAAGEDDVQDDS